MQELDADFRENPRLLKNSIQARLWVPRAAPEAPNRCFWGCIESRKRASGCFSTRWHLPRTLMNKLRCEVKPTYDVCEVWLEQCRQNTEAPKTLGAVSDPESAVGRSSWGNRSSGLTTTRPLWCNGGLKAIRGGSSRDAGGRDERSHQTLRREARALRDRLSRRGG